MTQPHANPIKAYTRASHTVAKTRQVVMLYDGAIRFLQQAAEAISQGNIEQRYLKLTRASEVVTGMQNCLDFTTGGDMAPLLYDFYAAIDMRIIDQHRAPNVAACEQLVRELKEMRDVWYQIDRGESPPGAEIAARPPGSDEPTPPPVPSTVKVSA